jgi:tripartite-type tricarboxylate transporter receptor subunit TctC
MTRTSIAGFCATVACLAAGPAAPADYPTKVIRILVGFPAGGPSDVPARLIADRLKTSLGQPVVVENKPGAAGMIAANDMLSQPRDGHTLLLCSYIDPINTLLYKQVSYKVEDLAPVTLVQKAYYAFTASSALPVESPISSATPRRGRPSSTTGAWARAR